MDSLLVDQRVVAAAEKAFQSALDTEILAVAGSMVDSFSILPVA